MPNERNTERIVRDHFDADTFPGLILDEQKTDDPRINRALSKASKAGDGVGRPEFILHASSAPNPVVLVECKALTRDHRSQHLDRPKDFAVDGALHYGKAVSAVCDVVAIGVSGQTEAKLQVDAFLFLQGTTTPIPLVDRDGPIDRLVSFQRLADAVKFDPAKRATEREAVLAFSRILHNQMRDDAKLTDQEKPLVVSGILIALLDGYFRDGYRGLRDDDLSDRLLEAIGRELKRAVPQAKASRIVQPYSFIASHEWLNAIPAGQSKTPLQNYCAELADQVLPYIQTYNDEDVVGYFYADRSREGRQAQAAHLRSWRVAVRGREREFGRLKTGWGLTPLRVRRLPRVTLHVNLAILAQLADAVVRADAGGWRHERVRDCRAV